MAGFRDQIESSKRQYDLEIAMRIEKQEFILQYANFIVQSIRSRLLKVSSQITKGTAYEYKGILLWENIPPFFFDSSTYPVKKWFSSFDCYHLDVNSNGEESFHYESSDAISSC